MHFSVKDIIYIDQASNITLVTENKPFEIANSQGMEAYMLKQRDLIKQKMLWEICQVIKTLIVINNDREKPKAKVTLLTKYADLVNIFSKQNTNVLLEYSIHNLAIETEKRKQLLFSFVYNPQPLNFKFFVNTLMKYQ